MVSRLLIAALLAALAVEPATAAVLYKSVSPEGSVTFSDMPPQKAQAVERIVMPDSSSRASSGNPVIVAGPTREEEMRGSDEAVQRANEQGDLAEHALAMARRPLWSEPNVRAISMQRMSRADYDRLEFYKKNVRIARQQLADVLREKHKADAKAIYTASNTVSSTEWTPFGVRPLSQR